MLQHAFNKYKLIIAEKYELNNCKCKKMEAVKTHSYFVWEKKSGKRLTKKKEYVILNWRWNRSFFYA